MTHEEKEFFKSERRKCKIHQVQEKVDECMKSNLFVPWAKLNPDKWLISFFYDELSFQKYLNSFEVSPTIQPSNKALTDEAKAHYKSERKKCNESFKIHQLQEKLDECMKLNVFEPMTKLSDKWLMLYLNDELSFHQLLDSFVVTKV